MTAAPADKASATIKTMKNTFGILLEQLQQQSQSSQQFSISSSSSQQPRSSDTDMPPKKRGRKPGCRAKPESPAPKRQRTVLESEDVKPDGQLIPEWLKMSIQMLLINFHKDGTALLHSIEKEYETCFGDPKVNPEIYGFSDWESMLKSSQFKNHFHVLIEKRIPHLKGSPLPRSATITRKGGIWEIDAKISGPFDLEANPEEAEESKASQNSINSTTTIAAATTTTSGTSGYKIPKRSASKPSTNTTDAKDSEANPNNKKNDTHPPSSRKEKEVNNTAEIQNGNSTSSSSTSVNAILKPPVLPAPLSNPIEAITRRLSISDESSNSGRNQQSENRDKNVFAMSNGGKNAINGKPHEEVLTNRTSVITATSNITTENAPRTNASKPLDAFVIKEPVLKLGITGNSTANKNGHDSATNPVPNSGRSQQKDMANVNETPLNVMRNTFGSQANMHQAFNPAQPEEITVVNRQSKNQAMPVATKTDNSSGGAPGQINDFQSNNFFRRNNVPGSWTSVMEAEADKKNSSSRQKDKNPTTDSVLVIDETPRMGRSELDSAISPSSERSSLSSSPPPPRLSPQNIWPRDVDLRTFLDETRKNNSRDRVERVDRDPRKKRNPDTTEQEADLRNQKPQRNKPKDHDLKRSESSSSSSVRRISDSTDSSTGNPAGGAESPKINKNGEEITAGWLYIPVIVGDLTANHIQNIQTAVEYNQFQAAKRDPRLTVGKRAPLLTFPEGGEEREEPAPAPTMAQEGGEASDGPKLDVMMKTSPLTQEYKDFEVSSDNASKESSASTESAEKSQNVPMLDKFPDMELRRENRRVLLPTPEMTPDVASNFKVTIDNQEGNIRSFGQSPRAVRHSLLSPSSPNSYRGEDVIPQDNFDLTSLKFHELWTNMTWKNRFDSDKGNPNLFFQSNIYDEWYEVTYKELRQWANPFIKELQIYEDKRYPSRCEYYLRSSLRMVEADYRTNGQFTDPRRIDTGESLVGPDEVLFYVDFAGAPGAVVEFYNKTRRLSSKGFGVTYQKRCYDLHIIPDVVPEFFEPFYGTLNSLNGDGSLFCTETVETFIARVMEATSGKGVHIVTTIGNVARIAYDNENDEKWKYQHLAQMMVALLVLREGGNMVFKMYDLKSAFSVALVYLLYRSFKSVKITKLNIFAPASSERALICLNKRKTGEISEIVRFLQECHKILADWYSKDKFHKSKRTIEELIPFTELAKHTVFMEFIKDSNERMKRTQMNEFMMCIKNLRRLKSIFNKTMYRSLVAKTTELWKVPNHEKRTTQPISRNPVVEVRELRLPNDVCEAVETSVNMYNMYSLFSSTQHWRFSPVGSRSKMRGFYMGVHGLPHFYQTKKKEWVIVRNHEFRLPSRSIVYGEILPIFANDHKTVVEEVFAIMDGLVLAGLDIRNIPYTERIRQCEKFAMSCTRFFFPRMTRVVVTKAFDFMQLPMFLEKILPSQTASSSDNTAAKEDISKQLVLSTETVLQQSGTSAKNRWIIPSGLVFFEGGETDMDFCTSVSNRIYWEWVPGMDLPLSTPEINGTESTEIDEIKPIGSVSARKMVNFVNRYK